MGRNLESTFWKLLTKTDNEEDVSTMCLCGMFIKNYQLYNNDNNNNINNNNDDDDNNNNNFFYDRDCGNSVYYTHLLKQIYKNFNSI